MTALLIGLTFVATVAFMEGFAYVMHRWVMHGRVGWVLHESHHRARTGLFELNDLYGVIFALPSIFLIYQGVQGDWGWPAAAIGAGIAGYGAIYFGFHDVIVHKRIDSGYVPRSTYMKRIVQAHRLHHVVESRLGCVSFGFVYAPPVEALKQQLSESEAARLRAPASTALRG